MIVAVAVAVLGALGASAVATTAEPVTVYGEAHPSVHWRRNGLEPSESERAQLMAQSQALVAVPLDSENRLGRVVRASAFGVEWEDESGLGASRPEAWLVEVSDVLVTDAGDASQCVTVPLKLVFDEHLNLLCALVVRDGQWAEPCEAGKPLLDVARDTLGWEVDGEPTAPMRTTIPEVLGRVWAVFAVSPWTAKYIALRPRVVSESPTIVNAPAPPAPWWLVEVRGAVVQVRNGFPYTGLLAGVRDGSPSGLHGTTLR